MPPRKKITPKVVKASGTGVARTLASILGVSPLETVEEVCERYSEMDGIPPYQSMLVSEVVGLYAWEVDVANSIMNSKPGMVSEFVDEMLCSSGEVWVVKDTQRSGKDAIWLVAASSQRDTPFIRSVWNLPIRGIFHTVVTEDGRTSVVTAVQLSSCHQL